VNKSKTKVQIYGAAANVLLGPLVIDILVSVCLEKMSNYMQFVV